MEKIEGTDSPLEEITTFVETDIYFTPVIKPKKVDQPVIGLGSDTISKMLKPQQEERLSLIKRGKRAALEGDREKK